MNNTRYMIKVTAEAKDSNPNFAGSTNIYYYGVGQSLIACHEETKVLPSRDIIESTVKEYGYKLKHMAEKAAKFWDDLNTNPSFAPHHWKYLTEIVPYTVS